MKLNHWSKKNIVKPINIRNDSRISGKDEKMASAPKDCSRNHYARLNDSLNTDTTETRNPNRV